jgi:hypothetical protein
VRGPKLDGRFHEKLEVLAQLSMMRAKIAERSAGLEQHRPASVQAREG